MAVGADVLHTTTAPPTARRGVSLHAVVGLAIVVSGLGAGLRQLADNSFLTHLATGRLILAHGIPRTDPYSFTAHGQPWVVQSWLASVVYAVTERVSGTVGIVLLHGAQTAALSWLAWRLTRRATTVLGRVLAVGPVMLLGAAMWAPRPLLFGAMCFAVTVLVAEDEHASPWWLLPVGWLWVNTHGSFPFGPAYLAIRLAGRAIDRRPTGRLRTLLAASAAGTLLGAVNPLGGRLLTFPLHVLGLQHSVLSHVVEWKSPDFSQPINLVFLLQAVAALALIGRQRRWEDTLVTAVFAVAGVMALRNTVLSSLAITPALATGLAGVGNIRGSHRMRSGPIAVVALVAAASLMVAGALSRPAVNLRGYPVAELSWMRSQGLLDGRVATQDYVGNLRTLLDGPHAEVFMDDRYDMYPKAFSEDTLALSDGLPRSLAILDRYDIDAVLWNRSRPLAGLLAASPQWRIVHRTAHWVVAVRAPAA